MGLIPKTYKWGALSPGQKSHVTRILNRYAYAVNNPKEFEIRRVSEATAKALRQNEYRVEGRTLITRKKTDTSIRVVAAKGGKGLGSIPSIITTKTYPDGTTFSVERFWLPRTPEEKQRLVDLLQRVRMRDKPYHQFIMGVGQSGAFSTRYLDLKTLLQYGNSRGPGSDVTQIGIGFYPQDEDYTRILRGDFDDQEMLEGFDDDE